jgi:hypothetical protein
LSSTVELYVSLFNDTTSTVTFLHENSDSTAANRFYLPGLTDLVLQPQSMASFIYLANTGNGSRWTCASRT